MDANEAKKLSTEGFEKTRIRNIVRYIANLDRDIKYATESGERTISILISKNGSKEIGKHYIDLGYKVDISDCMPYNDIRISWYD